MPTGVRRAALCECRAEPCEALCGHAVPHAVVKVDEPRPLLLRLRVHPRRVDGHDLGREPALLLRAGGLLERARGKGVLCGAGDAKVGCDVLGREPHGDKAVLCQRVGEDGRREAVRVGAGVVAERHALNARACEGLSAEGKPGCTRTHRCQCRSALRG